MEINTKAILRMGKSMESAPIIILMVRSISENSIIILFMVKECIHGQIIKNMRANGLKIRKTEKVHLLLLMDANISENTSMIRKKATANSCGLMDDATEEVGSMENNMAKEFILLKMGNPNMENGSLARRLNLLFEYLFSH